MHKPRSGWASSKLHLALIGMVMVTAVFVFVVYATGSAAGFGEYCIAMVSFAGAFSAARVGETFAQRPRPGSPPPEPSPSAPSLG